MSSLLLQQKKVFPLERQFYNTEQERGRDKGESEGETREEYSYFNKENINITTFFHPKGEYLIKAVCVYFCKHTSLTLLRLFILLS